MLVPLDQINLHPDFQPRLRLNQDALNSYVYMLEEYGFDLMPPVDLLFYDEKYYLIHGHHRFQAFKIKNLPEIPSVVHEGLTWDDGIRLAMTANISNGLQLTHKELAIACQRYLAVSDRLPEEARESDRAIARKFLVSPKTIRNYRKINNARQLCLGWQQGTLIIHKDYQEYPVCLWSLFVVKVFQVDSSACDVSVVGFSPFVRSGIARVLDFGDLPLDFEPVFFTTGEYGYHIDFGYGLVFSVEDEFLFFGWNNAQTVYVTPNSISFCFLSQEQAEILCPQLVIDTRQYGAVTAAKLRCETLLASNGKAGLPYSETLVRACDRFFEIFGFNQSVPEVEDEPQFDISEYPRPADLPSAEDSDDEGAIDSTSLNKLFLMLDQLEVEDLRKVVVHCERLIDIKSVF